MKLRSSLPLALLGATLGLLSTSAHADPRLGLDGGIFIPSSSKTRGAFGSNFKSIGPGFGSVRVSKRRLYPDLDLLREKEHGNKATVVFAGAKLLVPLGKPLLSTETTGFAPYGGFGLNLTYADIDAPSVGVNDSGVGAGASAILGSSFGTHLFAEGRYRLSTSAAHFNFSGGQIVIGARF